MQNRALIHKYLDEVLDKVPTATRVDVTILILDQEAWVLLKKASRMVDGTSVPIEVERKTNA